MEFAQDSGPCRPGYRLQRLELFNWGTFDSSGGQVFRFEPAGRTALMVGHNGSGKSTLVDSLLTLLVGGNIRSYNVAAGATRFERNEESYIRGAYNRTADDSQTGVVKYLRERGSTFSAIAGVFRDEQLDREFTLCVVLHLTTNGADKVFALADEERELSVDLQGLRASDGITSHFQSHGYRTTKTFTEYHGWLTKRTGMRPKAMDLFNQTVSVKDIHSLNDFVRRRMLEVHDWREKVDRLLRHFNDLSVAHQELVRARKAEELLTPIEKIGIRYRDQAEQMEAIEARLEAADTFFASETVRLFEPEVTRLTGELTAVVETKERLRQEIDTAEEQKWQLKNEIEQAGGDRLRKIPDLIEIERANLARKTDTFQRFHNQLRLAGVEKGVGTSEELSAVRKRLLEIQQETASQIAATGEMHEAAIAERGSIRRTLHDEQEELRILNERRTNLPAHLATLRARICADLDMEESKLPFAAELIAVTAEERNWEASAELVLSSFGKTLLVQEPFYRRVRGYIESNRLLDGRGNGQRLEYSRVGRARDEGGDRIQPQSLYRKLAFRDHSLAPWVRSEILRRFDYCCCNSVEEFDQATQLAMTANRHIKRGRDLHIKDDRQQAIDPRHFILGWDNREKKILLAVRIRELEAELRQYDATIAGHAETLQRLNRRNDAATEALLLHDFDTIDVDRHRDAITALEEEKKQLESSNEAVQALKQRLAELEIKSASLKDERDERVREEDQLSKLIGQGSLALGNAKKALGSATASGDLAMYAPHFDAICETLSDPPLSFANLFERKPVWESQTNTEVRRLARELEPSKDRLVDAMNKYLREMREEQTDLSGNVACLGSFLDRLEQIRDEDLPRHEKKFKDGLNDKVSQEIGTFHSGLRQECRELEDRIEQLNVALAQLDYRTGTFMRLEPRPISDRQIDDFKRSLRECLDESLENTDDANEARFVRIQELVQRMADKDEARWRDRVIDVRNWYSFAAREIDRETNETRGFYEGSSGQSGGEKAKLAFTILVAAIAYQNDIDPDQMTPGRFHFVVVDEMFSKIDDENAKRALRLFERFGLQILIVAPLDAKARVTEPFVDSYLHVVKDETTNRSQLYSMTAREYEEIVKGFDEDSTATRAPRRSPK